MVKLYIVDFRQVFKCRNFIIVAFEFFFLL